VGIAGNILGLLNVGHYYLICCRQHRRLCRPLTSDIDCDTAIHRRAFPRATLFQQQTQTLVC
jgi:hypothetical protein